MDSRGAELAGELSAARKRAGLTQQQVATFLGCTQSKITKLENAANNLKPSDLEQLLTLYRPPLAQLARIKELAALPSPGLAGVARKQPAAYVRMLDCEKRATVALALHSERIPRPLQSDHYRLKQYHNAGDPTPQTALLRDRDDRARLFTDPDRATRYRVLLSESALHRMPGGRTPSLVIDQAQHLLDLVERYARLSLQVVTYQANIPFMDADFTVFKFPSPKNDVAFVDTNVDAQLIGGTQRVADREKYWHLVQREALSPVDTKKHLHDLIDSANAGW